MLEMLLLACSLSELPPPLTFTPTEIHLDTIREDDPAVSIRFPFEVTRGPITLTDPLSSCPCTRLQNYPTRTLQQGDTGSVVVSFHPAGQSEETLRTIDIYCQEQPESAVERLFITAYVSPPADPFYHYPYRYDPLRLMQENVRFSPEKSRTALLLANASPHDTLRLSVIATPPGIWVSPMTLSLPPLKSGSIEIRQTTPPSSSERQTTPTEGAIILRTGQKEYKVKVETER